MVADWEACRINANQLTRFVALRSMLASIDDLNAYLESFGPGIKKWDETEFAYAIEHIASPEHLFAIGQDWQILNSPVTVSFGGTVSPTADGFQLAELFAQQAVLNSNAVIIGGGVIGIDMAAHLGALDVNGKTVAVLANPVTMGLHPYVPRRAFLENGILERGGLVVSEYDVPCDDRRERLLQRDRVITALSDVFVAVECSTTSATVDAAIRAKIQRKSVVAVDWSNIAKTWHEPKAKGSRTLIEKGIAKSIPSRPVSDIRDPSLLKEFQELFNGRSSQHTEAG